MDIKAYISSGILDNYCLGFCSPEENVSVEKNAEAYPEIKKEIDRIRQSMEEFLLSNEIKPAPSVKLGVMLSVYENMAASGNEYMPLIKEHTDPSILAGWIEEKNIPPPATDFENLFIAELPSTEQVTNFMVYAKQGHEKEIHFDFIEYLYIISGSCTMDFEGEKRSYREGEIIRIGKNIDHSAVVTSPQPMVALVQRQACL